MTPTEAIGELNGVLAHLWMIRTFLKHAEEIQDDAEMLEVPRTLYDSIRAVEPSFLSGDYAKYLRRLRGKLPKLRKVADYYSANYKNFSPHTNYEMAAQSLNASLKRLEDIFAQLKLETVNEVTVDTEDQ
ncbi:hypothetical protein KIH39_13095 [Telmatocola sphagniphila]|uniref:Uncharacterized protein n=1 Tax=Telmatocola sphagniphila TaxID=1123043 RepID=A0A8E6ERX8_9BACT|nr:hypothetical protein [Telmatocola sphagniphila]QVL29809.1 hypothetical protein KIH39_13095 [Telmatocola sphagniphila]